MDQSFGLFFSVMLSINFFIIISTLLILIFIEWNQSDYIKDIRFIVSILYIDIFLIVLKLFTNVENYKLHFLINEVIVTTMVITHYILIFGSRIILMYKKESKEESLNSCIKEALKMNEDYRSSLKKQNSSPEKESNSVISKIMKYHYSRSSLPLEETSFIISLSTSPSINSNYINENCEINTKI